MMMEVSRVGRWNQRWCKVAPPASTSPPPYAPAARPVTTCWRWWWYPCCLTTTMTITTTATTTIATAMMFRLFQHHFFSMWMIGKIGEQVHLIINSSWAILHTHVIPKFSLLFCFGSFATHLQTVAAVTEISCWSRQCSLHAADPCSLLISRSCPQYKRSAIPWRSSSKFSSSPLSQNLSELGN